MFWRSKSGKDRADNQTENGMSPEQQQNTEERASDEEADIQMRDTSEPSEDIGAESFSREDILKQDEKAREMYESIIGLRKSLESLKRENPFDSSQDGKKSAKSDVAEESEEVIAAKQAIIERAKEDKKRELERQEEERQRQIRMRQEELKVLEAQKKAARISEEAERKRIEALEAEKRAKEVARKKALELMEAERRRAKEKETLSQHSATPEEMAAFFGYEDNSRDVRADKKQTVYETENIEASEGDGHKALDDLKEGLLSEKEKQGALFGKISEIAGEKTGKMAESQKAKTEEIAKIQRKLKEEQKERLRMQQLKTEYEKAKAEEALRIKNEQAEKRIAEKQTRKERIRAERIAKVQRKRVEKARKAMEKERVRLEKKRAALELERLKAEKKADAEMGGGIVNVQGLKITTEVNKKPTFKWRDFFGFRSREERKAETEEERLALKEEREERREQARATAEYLSIKRKRDYENSKFGKKMAVFKSYCDRHRKVLLMGFSVVVMSIVGVAGVINYCTAFEYSYNGQVLGIVKDQDDVLRITDLVQGALTEEKKMDVVIDAKNDISFKRVYALNESTQIDTSEDVLKRLTYMGDLNIKATGIFVNGEKVGAVKDEKTAAQVLQDIKDKYSGSMEGAEIEEAVFIEDVEVKDSNTDLQDMLTEQEMVDLLCTSSKKETVHKVVAGDTLSSVAKLYSTTEEDILADNENIDSKKLDVGSSIVIKQNAPIVTVKITEKVTYDKVIEHKTEEKDSADIYEGYTETQQKGSDGLSEVTSRITTVNGEIIDETNLVTTVKTEPVTEVVLVGTKERPPTVGSGKYAWPLKDSFTRTTGFETRWGDFHQGVDLACSQGTNIYAADGGTVTTAGYSGTYGLLVVIDHQNGQETRYAHCSKLLVNVGDKVFQGQHIAEVGSTGRSTGPHLHFEIRINGTPKNPYNYLP